MKNIVSMLNDLSELKCWVKDGNNFIFNVNEKYKVIQIDLKSLEKHFSLSCIMNDEKISEFLVEAIVFDFYKFTIKLKEPFIIECISTVGRGINMKVNYHPFRINPDYTYKRI